MPAALWACPGRPGYPGGEALALLELSQIAMHADDPGSAVRLGWQARQITAGIPGRIGRACTTSLAGALIEAGDLAAAEGVCAAALASFRDAGHLENLTQLLSQMALLELNTGRVEDGAAGTAPAPFAAGAPVPH